jgi:hypothetical protein
MMVGRETMRSRTSRKRVFGLMSSPVVLTFFDSWWSAAMRVTVPVVRSVGA